MKKIIFSLAPLILLFLVSETFLSILNFSPFVPLPEVTPPIEKTRVSPWGDTRVVKERIFLGAPAVYELPNFRAFVPPVEKKIDVKRIVFMGDSFVFGTGVAEYETLPFYLSAYLRYYKPELTVEMVNLGWPGGNTQDYVQLCETGARYQPDLVVLGFTIANDAEIYNRRQVEAEQVVPDAQKTNKRSLWETLTHLRGLRDFSLTHSRTLSALYRPLRKLESKARQDLYMKTTFDDEHKWKTVQQNLIEFSKYYSSRGVPVIFIIYPYAFSSRQVGLNDIEKYPYINYHRRLHGFAHTVGFTAIDFLDYFKQENVQSFDPYIVDGDGHPNGAFNAFVARHFAHELLTRPLF
jgi:hypothetical protein